MAILVKSTTYTRMFKLIASSDHISKLTGGSPTVNISKAGAAFGAAAGSVAEVANGWYTVALTTADTGTAGDLAYYITCASADDTDFVDQVWDPAVAKVGVNLVNILGTVASTPATAGILDVNVKNIVNAAAQIDGNNLLEVDVVDWKGSAAAAMTGDAYATLTGTNTELTGAPASTVSLAVMIKWLFLLARNLITQTASTTTVYANDGATPVSTSTVSDDGTTFSRGKLS